MKIIYKLGDPMSRWVRAELRLRQEHSVFILKLDTQTLIGEL